MKQTKILYGITIAALLLSNVSYGQTKKRQNKTHVIVEKLNRPSKIWNDGCWVVQRDGSRIWKKGYWGFKEKSFQEKSKLFKRKTSNKNKSFS